MVGCPASGFALTTPYGPLQVSSGGEGMALSTAHGGLQTAIRAYNYKLIVKLLPQRESVAAA
jgi:hypothetical protein